MKRAPPEIAGRPNLWAPSALAIMAAHLNGAFFLAPARSLVMLGQFGLSRASSGNVGEIERRLRSLEQRLARAGSRASAGAVETADQVGDSIASALSSIADRLRGGADSMSGEAAKIGSEAAKLGNDALRRLAREVEHRPLVMLGVALGVGILIGWASHRADGPGSTGRAARTKRTPKE